MLMQLLCIWLSSSFLSQSDVEVRYPVVNVRHLLVDIKSRLPFFTSLPFMFVSYGKREIWLLLDRLIVNLVINMKLNISLHVFWTSQVIS